MIKRVTAIVLKGLAILILCFLIFLAIICGYLAGSMLEIAKQAPEMNPDLLLTNLAENSKIVNADGELVEQIDTAEYREIVPFERIPDHLVNAFISAEDKRFLQHDGVDFYGIAATVYGFLRSGDLRGASTITMQLARNVFLNNDVNWTRKIQEIFLSWEIEDKISKDQIMESYLNRIFFGQNAYGVQAAAQIYFSKNVEDLTLAECATLASIVPAPSRYALYSTYRPSEVTDERVLDETTINGEKYLAVYNPPAYERAKWVLEQMKENGYISDQEYQEAVATDVSQSINAPDRRMENLSTYVTDLVKEQTIQILMDTQKISEEKARELMVYGGLTITQTIDMNLQNRLQEMVSSLTSYIDTPTGDSEPLRLELNYDDDGNLLGRNGSFLYYKKSNLLDDENRVVLPDDQFDVNDDGSLTLYPGRVRGHQGYLELLDYYTFDDNDVLYTHKLGTIPIAEKYLKMDDEGVMHIDKAYFDSNEKPLYEVRDDGALVLNHEFYTNDEIGIKQPQIAFTVIDTASGEIKAIIGGREQDNRHILNRAMSYPRQPGSSFKPIAEYTEAFKQGFNQASGQNDAPVEMIDGTPWPVNVDGRYRGWINMQDALVLSSNPVAVRWLNQVGIDAIKETLTGYGIINQDHPDRDHFVESSENAQFNDENESLAIGAMTEGVTTLEMAGAYQAIGNGGNHIAPMSVSKIVDNRGKVYYENKKETTEVLSPAVNYQLQDLLVRVVDQGFTSSTFNPGDMSVAGKTGTTSENSDYWMCTTSPYYSTAVWVGADNALLSLVGNSSVAAAVYANIFPILHEELEDRSFDRPEGVRDEEVANLSGMLPSDAAYAMNAVITIPVSDETAPDEVDTQYVYREVDVRNGLLAGERTPGWLRSSKPFFNPPVEYNPSDFNGVTPEDWGVRIPTAYSDLGDFLMPPNSVRTMNDDGTFTVTTTLADGSKQVKHYDAKGQELSTEIIPAQSSESSSESEEKNGNPLFPFPNLFEDDPQEDTNHD